MGYGTGVLRAHYAYCLARGLATVCLGVSSLAIVRNTGAKQNLLFASRGVGLVIGPIILSRSIGWSAWSGESQSMLISLVSLKICCLLIIPRTASCSILYLALLMLGVATSALDTQETYLASMVHGKDVSFYMITFCAVYGIGCMVAPFFALRFEERSFNLVILIDVLIVVAVARRRVLGKPHQWKVKLRKTSTAVQTIVANINARPDDEQALASRQSSVHMPEVENQSCQPTIQKQVPRRILMLGMLLIFLSEAIETAMSCWCFTYAVSELHLIEQVAAYFPSTFYFGFTAARFVVLPASKTLLPSTICHIGSMLVLLGSVCFYSISTSIVAVGVDQPLPIKSLLFSLLIFGCGSSPLYSVILSSVRQHGDLSAEETGWYTTFASLGIAAGNYFPGFVALPVMMLVGASAIVCILNSNARHFPRCASDS